MKKLLNRADVLDTILTQVHHSTLTEMAVTIIGMLFFKTET